MTQEEINELKRKKVLDAFYAGEKIPIENGTIRLLSEKCVNSSITHPWVAGWLADEHQEYCQCIVQCKVAVGVEMNGWPEHKVIMDRDELYSFIEI